MNSMPASQGCPVDLDYPEPVPVRLGVAPIVRRGQMIRRRRRLAAFGSALAACAAAASVLAGTHGAVFGRHLPVPVTAPGPPATPIDSLVAENPPVTGTLTLLSSQPPHWTTVVWATRRGQVCWATFRTPMDGALTDSDCWNSVDIPGPGHQQLSPLLPGLSPPGPAGSGAVAEFGLVTPRAVRVTVTFSGHKFSAGVVTVPLGHGKTIGAYLIWPQVPPGAHGYGSSDVSGAIAYDPAGRIVARHGPGM